jgi:hypothetical protein
MASREAQMNDGEFFDLAYQIASDAAHRVEHYQFGDYGLSTSFSSPELAQYLGKAMAHQRVPKPARSSLSVCCIEEELIGRQLPAPPWRWEDHLPRGTFRGWESGRYRVQYNAPDGRLANLLLMDTDTGRAVYWAKRANQIPWWEHTSPFRQIIHWWASGKPIQPMHSGAIGLGGTGVLIAGRSGSGKSTSCLSCLNSDLEYAGDDFVMVELEGHMPKVQSLYATAKLEPSNLHRFPWIQDWICNPDQLEDQKALVRLQDHAPDRLSKGFLIQAILMPKITGKPDTRISPAKGADAMQAIAPSTVFQLVGDETQVLQKVSRLVRSVPAYWLEAGTDLTQIPLRIKEFLKGGA